MTALEQAITELTQPIAGQFPRPWMTDLAAPQEANVFIVGKNQRNGYDASKITHERHLDALFNRHGETCRGLYNEITGNSPSPTRLNTDRFRDLLKTEGVDSVVETLVVCYTTPMSSHLRLAHNVAGTRNGKEVFSALLQIIQPKVLIVHGAGAAKELSAVLAAQLPDEPSESSPPAFAQVGKQTIFVIPSLAPPAFKKWSKWSVPHLTKVASTIAKAL